MTWAQCCDGVAILTAAFPKLGPEEATIKIWFALLRDLPADAFERGVLSVCRSVKELYPGTNLVALIRDAALPDDAPTPLLAWQQVNEAVDKHGQPPATLHPRALAVAESLGWAMLRWLEDRTVARAHFLKEYAVLTTQARQQTLVGMDTTLALPVQP